MMKKRTLIVLLLLAVCTLSNGAAREYHYFPLLKTWAEAQKFCRENYVDLAIIDTEEEYLKVTQIVQKFQLDSWIGLYNDYTGWRWALDGKYFNQDIDTPFGDWFHTENLHTEQCAEIYQFKLEDSSCDRLVYRVCFDEQTNSHVPYKDRRNWFDSQIFCRLHHTDLASIRNEQEKDAILAKITSDSYWVGLSRESWKWSDQTPFLLKKWAEGEGSATLSQFCASVYNGYIDNPCTNPKPFVCSVPMMKIFKLKMVTTLNLDNQAAQAILLQNLEKKLKENGIQQNFTLQWRKAANGKTFNKESCPNPSETVKKSCS